MTVVSISKSEMINKLMKRLLQRKSNITHRQFVRHLKKVQYAK